MSKIKGWAWKSLYSSGAFHLANAISKSQPKIIVYHRFGPADDSKRIGVATFEHQIKLLRRNCNVMALRDLSALITNGRPIPPYSVILTIDDGYEDFYDYAFPILKQYSIPATIYVTTDFIDQKIWLWPDYIEFVISQTQCRDYSFRVDERQRRYHFENDEDRHQAWSDIADYCLTLKNSEKNLVLERLAQELKVSVPSCPEKAYRALSWEQIVQMAKHGIEIGSHTVTHPRLVTVDTSDLPYEVEGSKSRIESVLGKPIDSFAYPHGSRTDFDDRVKEVVKRAGYKNAMAGYLDLSITDDLYALKRYGVGSDMKSFVSVVYGIEYLSKAIERS